MFIVIKSITNKATIPNAEQLGVDPKYKKVWVNSVVNINHICIIDPNVEDESEGESFVYLIDGTCMRCKETTQQIHEKINKSINLLNSYKLN